MATPGGLRPPAPIKTNAPSYVQRFDNGVPGTAGATDPLADVNADIQLDKNRADFRIVEFNRVLLQHGKRVTWRKAMLCPCLNETTGQADLVCKECDGSGYVYVDPLPIKAHMVSFEKNTRLYEKFGLWASGEVSVSVQPNYRLGYRDSIEMTDDLMNFNELIKKGNRVGGKRADLPAHIDAARYRIAQLTKALVMPKDSAGIISLEVGASLRLTDQGLIEWLPAGERLVPDGSYVSVHYDYHPVWIVTSHPHAQRSDVALTGLPNEAAVALPLQASAQLDFLAETDRKLPVTGL
jgi:hypothetical protein